MTAPAPAMVPLAPAAEAVCLLEAHLRRTLPPGARILPREPLARRTTLRVGGPADLLVEPANEQELSLLLHAARAFAVPWRVIGRGSNLLVRDSGVRGLVICLSSPAFAQVEVNAPLLRCGAGVRLKDLAATARRHGLAGLEFLAGIPGSVGGALRMNAGAWNSMTFDRVDSVRFLTPDGEVREARGPDIPTAYRRCDLLRDHIAVAATVRGDPSTPEQVEARLNELNSKRWASQPAAPSAGCIFKNPAALPA
ncbi:MAG: FAD-binding protein, partial [Verrucomicrobiales bacterium]|nr:FAD-binding protein [Verrucomicrobiales bacterium]